jgi:hypothetical protein
MHGVWTPEESGRQEKAQFGAPRLEAAGPDLYG